MVTRQPRHVVTFSGERQAGAKCTIATWDYTRAEPTPTALEKALADLRASVDTTAIVSGGIALWQGEPLLALPPAVKLMSHSYYVVKAFGEEIVSRERLKKEIERLRNQPQIHSRVCVECSSVDTEFEVRHTTLCRTACEEPVSGAGVTARA